LNKGFRLPDLHAPRYKAKRLSIMNADFCEEFRKENPKFSHLTNEQIKRIIREVNDRIWQTVIDERDGIELPEQLGYIFIGSCPAKKGLNSDYEKSKLYQKLIQHRNWESDNYLAKIFYTNYGSKYKFMFSKLWGFKPVREFSRTVAKVYPQQFTKYLMVENNRKINHIFREQSKQMDMKKIEEEELKEYNEFDLD